MQGQKQIEQLIEEQKNLGKKIFADTQEDFLAKMLSDFPSEETPADNIARRKKLDDALLAYETIRADRTMPVALTELQALAPVGSKNRRRLDGIFSANRDASLDVDGEEDKAPPPEAFGDGSINLGLSSVNYNVQVTRTHGALGTPYDDRVCSVAALLATGIPTTPLVVLQTAPHIHLNATQKIALTAFMSACSQRTAEALNPPGLVEGSMDSVLTAPITAAGSVDPDLIQMGLHMPRLSTDIPLVHALEKIIAKKGQIFVGETCMLTKEFRQVLREDLHTLRTSHNLPSIQPEPLQPTAPKTKAELDHFARTEQQEGEQVVRESAQRAMDDAKHAADNTIFHPENVDAVRTAAETVRTALNASAPPQDGKAQQDDAETHEAKVATLVTATVQLKAATRHLMEQEEKPLAQIHAHTTIAEQKGDAPQALEKAAAAAATNLLRSLIEAAKEAIVEARQLKLGRLQMKIEAIVEATTAGNALCTALDHLQNGGVGDEQPGDQEWNSLAVAIQKVKRASKNLVTLTDELKREIAFTDILHTLQEAITSRDWDSGTLNEQLTDKTIQLQQALLSEQISHQEICEITERVQRLFESLPTQKKLFELLDKLEGKGANDHNVLQLVMAQKDIAALIEVGGRSIKGQTLQETLQSTERTLRQIEGSFNKPAKRSSVINWAHHFSKSKKKKPKAKAEVGTALQNPAAGAIPPKKEW